MSDPGQNQAPAALDGRLPVLPHERVYGTYGALLWTTAVLGAASYAYLIGSALQAFGNTSLSIIGYLVGLIVGEVFVVLAVGAASWRYGIDTIDAAKAALGARGSIVLLLTVLSTCLGWAYVLIAMTARGIGQLRDPAVAGARGASEPTIVMCGLAILLLVWFLARRGPSAMERLSRVCALAQVVVACLILAMLLQQHGSTVCRIAGFAAHGTPADRLTAMAFGVEFGFDNALSLLPFLGGLTRLVRHKRHVMGPTVLGSGIVGAALIAAVAALAGATFGETDPISWIMKLAGGRLALAFVAFLLVANLGTMVVQIYVASVAIQQVRMLASLPMKWIIAVTLVPAVPIVFQTEWVLAHVMTWLAYNGVMFVGLAGVLGGDFFILRRQQLHVAHLFAGPRQGAYQYPGGVNWVAMLALAGAAAIYLFLFDPVTLRVQPVFRYLGAGIPAVLLAGISYCLAMSVLHRSASSADQGPAAASHPLPLKVGL